MSEKRESFVHPLTFSPPRNEVSSNIVVSLDVSSKTIRFSNENRRDFIRYLDWTAQVLLYTAHVFINLLTKYTQVDLQNSQSLTILFSNSCLEEKIYNYNYILHNYVFFKKSWIK